MPYGSMLAVVHPYGVPFHMEVVDVVVLQYVVSSNQVECRSPGNGIQASGRAKDAAGGPNTRKVSFFALAFRRVVMSLEGKKAADGDGQVACS